MALESGEHLGPYEIVEPLGRGGMGEVYRARDSKLGRDVAIKVLPEEVSRDAERLARFNREARVLASLSHPNIAAIYGLEKSGTTDYLVLELVEGETLQERLARGPMTFAEAIAVAARIAVALGAAHDRGIVHRDLKPANVKIAPDDEVKVLDFGLAKAVSEDAPEIDSSLSPTLTRDATRLGVILGTAAYMSPEQAKGKRVDRRADVFAFGAVLYEMLTGKKAFPGDDVSDVLAAVLKLEPDWTALPEGLPDRFESLLRWCLEKDVKKRRRDLGDLAVELPTFAHGRDDGVEVTSPAGRSRWWLALAAAAAVSSVVTWVALRDASSAAPPPLRRFDVPLPEGRELVPDNRHLLALSPSGEHLVVNVDDQLYLRRLDETGFRPLPGTENAREPFFSPDSAWIGFWAEGRLKKLSLGGGAPVSLCAAESPFGASWSSNGAIVFAQSDGIYEVSARGGEPRLLVEERTDFARSPERLPGDAVLFSVANGLTRERSIVVERLDTHERKTLISEGKYARFLPNGHLLYGVGSTLFAIGFDLEALEAVGEGVPIAESVASFYDGSAMQFDVSREGTLAFMRREGSYDRRLVWVDRVGRATPLSDRAGPFAGPRLSPDGKRVALWIPQADDDDVWILDATLDTLTRLTSDGKSQSGNWSPDGEWILYSSRSSGGDLDLYRIRSDFTGHPEIVLEREGDQFGWYAPDGSGIVFQSGNLRDFDIWWLPFDTGESQLIVESPANDSYPSVSPDGRWLAYHSSISGGELEVFLQPFPGPGPRRQISTDGGLFPTWARERSEIFYDGASGWSVTAVEIGPEPDPSIGPRRVLFEAAIPSGRGGRTWDVSSDGDRFVMLVPDEPERTTSVELVLNWADQLRR